MSMHLTGGSASVFLVGIPAAVGIIAVALLHSALWGLIASIGVLVTMFVPYPSRKATKDDVAKAIEDFVNGTGGPWDWEDFISVRLADDELEESESNAFVRNRNIRASQTDGVTMKV